ncbi:hypothetical protein NP945_10430 [Mesorhizobium sp. LMG17149]|uniref:hypothetical protein n=1 Tax=Mesorhizobium sp. LMG17149 TaxID=2968497 RepID=UPI0021196C2D|nr:hypothetical protein [Mesorhizobium sp. LMG17149]MCQ8872235.1 hypothetical protein [Mesorhizobium sp. LMG17149]
MAANATQIAGAAVNTATAQLGVNVISAAGTAWNSGSILAKARRKANGEVEPETPEQEPRSPFDEPVLAPKDYAALVAALVASSMPRAVVEDDDEDEMLAILLLAA